MPLLEHPLEIKACQEDIKQELEKFGPLQKVILPTRQAKNCREKDMCAFYVEFKEVAAGFVCYNLLN